MKILPHPNTPLFRKLLRRQSFRLSLRRYSHGKIWRRDPRQAVPYSRFLASVFGWRLRVRGNFMVFEKR